MKDSFYDMSVSFYLDHLEGWLETLSRYDYKPAGFVWPALEETIRLLERRIKHG